MQFPFVNLQFYHRKVSHDSILSFLMWGMHCSYSSARRYEQSSACAQESEFVNHAESCSLFCHVRRSLLP